MGFGPTFNFIFFTILICPFAMASLYPTVVYKNSWKCRRVKPAWDTRGASNAGQVYGWTERITMFPDKISIEKASPEDDGCYAIKAKVLVRETIKEPFQARLVIRLGGTRAEPLPCSRTVEEEKSCDSGWGSCIYCNMCNVLANAGSIEVDGQTQIVQCPLPKGWRTLSHRFCLPRVSEFSKLIPDDLQQIIRAQELQTEGDVAVKDMFLHLELYDHDIYSTCSSFRSAAAQCDFNQKDTMIGCITVFTTIRVTLAQLDSSSSK